MNLSAQVSEDGGRGIAQIVEHLDEPTLFANEDAPVHGEAEDGRVAEAADRRRLGKPGWQRRRVGAQRGQRHQPNGHERSRHDG
jgi:hypothetical protein